MWKRILFFLSICVYSLPLAAQADIDAVNLADEMYGFGDKRDALDVYLQAATLNPSNVRANYMAGKCYQETIEKEKSVPYLIKAYELDENVSEDILYVIGKGYQYGGNFDKAIEYFGKYKDDLARFSPSNKEEMGKKTNKHIAECEFAKTFYKQKVTKELVNLGGILNSEYPEYSPVISADESIIIFTSRRQGTTGNKKDVDNEFFEDIYVSKKMGDGQWETPKNIGTNINTEFHEASNGLSPDGKLLYIFREVNGGDIFECKQMTDGSWSKPKKLDHINTKSKEASITYSGDGKTLIFTSDRPGGDGKLDMYMSKQDEKGKWSKPANIGNELNTAYDEDSPFLSHDGNTLFFSSAGHNSMGGYDIFKSTLTNGKWGKPENMGYPINTTDNDIFYVESGDGLHGYYASVRSDGFGETDLYIITNKKHEEPTKDSVVAAVEETKDSATIAPAEASTKQKVAVASLKAVTVKGRVFDAESENGVKATIEVVDEKGKIVRKIQTSEDGNYSVSLSEKKKRNYTLVAHLTGFVKKSQKMTIVPSTDESESVQDFALSKYETGKNYILRNVYFDFNQATLKTESNDELQKLVEMMKNSPNSKVEIAGHTDFVGSMEYNRLLSQKRAQEVVNYLIRKGVSPSRLKAVGYGKEHPLASNDDEAEGRELNRRTEFKIL